MSWVLNEWSTKQGRGNSYGWAIPLLHNSTWLYPEEVRLAQETCCGTASRPILSANVGSVTWFLGAKGAMLSDRGKRMLFASKRKSILNPIQVCNICAQREISGRNQVWDKEMLLERDREKETRWKEKADFFKARRELGLVFGRSYRQIFFFQYVPIKSCQGQGLEW